MPPTLERLMTAACVIAATALSITCCGGSAGQSGARAPDRPPDLAFEQDGESYAVIEGAIYRRRADGELRYMDRLYEKDFHERNFRQVDGQLFQIDPETGKRYVVTRGFSDGFESASSVEDLIVESRWHSSTVDPSRSGQRDNFYALGNRISLSTEKVHSGNNSLRCLAVPSSKRPSKASLSRNIMYFGKGDTVSMSGWFFLEDTPNIYDGGGFTLFDLETSFFKSFVGVRAIFSSTDSLAFELEFPKTKFRQDEGSEVRFPTNRWVQVEAEVLLTDEEGRVRLWQDGRLVLDRTGRTLPLADTIYDRFEVGISAIAQGARHEKVLYVDDVEITTAREAR